MAAPLHLLYDLRDSDVIDITFVLMSFMYSRTSFGGQWCAYIFILLIVSFFAINLVVLILFLGVLMGVVSSS